MTRSAALRSSAVAQCGVTMRFLALCIVCTATAALPCDLAPAPYNPKTLTSGEKPEATSNVSDATPPSLVTIDALTVTLVKNACDGASAACAELDTAAVTFTATDDVSAAKDLRYVVSFGATEGDATSAEALLLVSSDYDDANRITAYLGGSGARSGVHFSRSTLCLTLAAVDGAGNIGPRSAARCVDTVRDDGNTVVEGNGCFGCSVSPGFAFAPLLAALLLRRRRR